MLQNVLDAIDAQITKTRSPLVNVLLVLPVFFIISLPIAFVVGSLVLIAIGTTPEVRQTAVIPGVIVGVLVVLFFTGWASYGTYTTSKQRQDQHSATSD